LFAIGKRDTAINALPQRDFRVKIMMFIERNASLVDGRSIRRR
jgi:hypothetical protein